MTVTAKALPMDFGSPASVEIWTKSCLAFFFINGRHPKNRQAGLCHFLGSMHPFPGRQNPHTLSNEDRISLKADGLIFSRKPRWELQDWQQQPRRSSLMALHVFS